MTRRRNPEHELCRTVWAALQTLHRTGRLKAVFFHVANEGKRSKLANYRLAQIGLVPGIADYIFLWSTGSGMIEMKAPGGCLSPAQKVVKAWCEQQGVSWALCRSLDDVLETVTGWGVLT